MKTRDLWKSDRSWKAVGTVLSTAMLLGCIHLARLHVLLNRYCADAVYQSCFGQKGLYLLALLTAGYTGLSLWQWMTACHTARKNAWRLAAVAACLYMVLAAGYLQYHQAVVHQSEGIAAYQQAYDRGAAYGLRSLFR